MHYDNVCHLARLYILPSTYSRHAGVLAVWVVVLARYGWWLGVVRNNDSATSSSVVDVNADVGLFDDIRLHKHVRRGTTHNDATVAPHTVASEDNKAVHCTIKAGIGRAAAVG